MSAVDAAGNESAKTDPISVTTDVADSGTTVTGDDWTATLTEVSGSELEIVFDHDADSTWVDVHYDVNDGTQQNERMTADGTTHSHVVDSLDSDDVVTFSFTYEANGLAYDSTTHTYTKH